MNGYAWMFMNHMDGQGCIGVDTDGYACIWVDWMSMDMCGYEWIWMDVGKCVFKNAFLKKIFSKMCFFRFRRFLKLFFFRTVFLEVVFPFEFGLKMRFG